MVTVLARRLVTRSTTDTMCASTCTGLVNLLWLASITTPPQDSPSEKNTWPAARSHTCAR